MNVWDAVIIFNDKPSEAKVVTYAEWGRKSSVELGAYTIIDAWEDAQRFAYDQNVMLVHDAKRSRPIKSLYTVMFVDRDGLDELSWVVWAHSKAEVIEWLRKENKGWWQGFKEHLQGQYPKYTDKMIAAMHPFQLLKHMEELRLEDWHGEPFRIIRTPQSEIVDIRTKKRRRHAL